MQKRALLVAINARYIHTALGVRSLKAYLRKDFEIDILELNISDNFHFMRETIFNYRAEFVGFSCYIWNIELILKLSCALHLMDPSIKIVLGGPEVSYNAAEILRDNPHIWGVISGEGEKAWRDLLTGESLSSIGGLHWRDESTIISNPPSMPVDLNEIPPAYDMDKLPQKPQIIYYESSRGCPFRCAFCLSRDHDLRYLEEERAIKDLCAFAEKNVHQVKLVDRTFNSDIARAKRIWRALSKLDTLTNFHFEIVAHLLDDEAIDILRSAPKGRFQLEIGVQTTNALTLSAISRPDKMDSIKSATKALRENDNVHLHLDLIAGLPYEDMASFKQSFDEVYALKPHMLQLGFLKLLKGSALEQSAKSFGCIYAPYPPYEVISTDDISVQEMLSLKLVERALERYSSQEQLSAAMGYLLEGCSAFDSYMEMGKALILRPAQKIEQIIKEIWEYSVKTSRDDEILMSLLLYGYFFREKQSQYPFPQSEPNDNIKMRARDFYRNDAKKFVECGNIPPWRACHLHVFPFDILLYMKSGEVVRRKCAVLFDYISGIHREIDWI